MARSRKLCAYGAAEVARFREVDCSYFRPEGWKPGKSCRCFGCAVRGNLAAMYADMGVEP